MKLSIIVPVYNVEEYISPCLESIFRQGLNATDFEVIVVNDDTRDGSMDIVAGFVATNDNITVVEQANQGLSAARNTGLDHASGDYVLFLDSDDLLISGTLPAVLQCAIQADADIAVADFVKMDNKEIETLTPHPSPLTSHPSQQENLPQWGEAGGGFHLSPLISGQELFLGEFNPRQCYVWRTLYKRSFLLSHGLRFIPGIYFEDVPFTTECYLRASKCVRVAQTFYIYRQRPNSIVSSVNMKKLTDFNTVLAHLAKLKVELCDTPSLRRRMDDTVFTTFSIAVWYLTHDKTLLADRRTFIDDLRRKVSDLSFSNGFKQRLVAFFYNLMPDFYIRLRAAL